MSNKKHFHHKKPKPQDNYKPPFPEAVLAEPITNLSLREETATLLTGAGITTIGDVLKRTETDFYKIMRFNKKNLMDVKFAIKKRNLFLKPLPVPTEGQSTEQAAKPGDKPAQNVPKDNRQSQPQQKSKNVPNGNGVQKQPQNNSDKGKNKQPQADNSYVMTTLIKRPPKPVKETIKEEQDKYVKVNKNGLWGFKERNSKEMPVPAVYDEVFSFKEELCCVQKGEKFGFVNRQGEEVIPLVYDCATSFSEGLACVFKGETCGYINKQNETVIEFKFDAGTPVVNGECRVKKAGKWGELHIDAPTEIRWII